MRLKTYIALSVAGAIALVAVIGVAGARTGGSVVTPPKIKIAALDRPFNPTNRQRKELYTLRRQISRSPSASIASTASVPDSRPIPLPQGLGDAWVSQAGDGSVCTFIPDPLGGYGASCTTQADLRFGGAITVLGGAGALNDEAIAVMVVPDGGSVPVVTQPNGDQERRPLDGIGATVVPESSRVTVGGVSLEIPVFNPHCASSANGEFRQCGL
jgi:hypothetical protein